MSYCLLYFILNYSALLFYKYEEYHTKQQRKEQIIFLREKLLLWLCISRFRTVYWQKVFYVSFTSSYIWDFILLKGTTKEMETFYKKPCMKSGAIWLFIQNIKYIIFSKIY